MPSILRSAAEAGSAIAAVMDTASAAGGTRNKCRLEMLGVPQSSHMARPLWGDDHRRGAPSSGHYPQWRLGSPRQTDRPRASPFRGHEVCSGPVATGAPTSVVVSHPLGRPEDARTLVSCTP